MPSLKLTALAVATLPPGNHFDALCPGLILRVGTRRRTWQYRWRAGGKNPAITLGHFPTLSVAGARAAAREAALRIDAGAAPAPAVAHPRSGDALTVGALVEKYERHRKREGKSLRTFAKVQAALRKELRPYWSLPVASLSKADLRTIRDGMIERGASIQWNRVRSALRVMLGWAAEEDILDAVPTIPHKSPERSRERVLSEPEIRVLWHACDRLGTNNARGVSEPFCRLAKLLLLTGLRRGEAAGIRYRDLLGDRLTIPETKQGKPHVLRLPPAALALIGRGEPDALAFAGPDGPIRGWSKSLTRLRLACGIKEAWHLHDLRRTFASHLQRLHVRPDTIELILGHTLPGLSAHGSVYLRGDQEEAKQAPLRLWADELQRIVATPEVVRLRAVS